MSSRRPKKPVGPFAFPKSSKTPEAYRNRISVLALKGITFGFRKNAKLTPQRKTAITRKLRKFAEFLNPENNFEYVPVSPALLKKVKRKGEIDKRQTTGKGVFVPTAKLPRGKKTKIKIDPRTAEVSTRTGKFRSVFRQYESAEVVADPSIIKRDMEELGAESAFISIKGNRGGARKNGYSLKNFTRYISERIVPDIEAAQDDDEIEIGGRRKKSAFKNFLGVEFVIYEWSGEKKKHKPKTKKKGKK
jgi:hypothetical protein